MTCNRCGRDMGRPLPFCGPCQKVFHDLDEDRGRLDLSGTDRTHGTNSAYVYGCRCRDCREAHNVYVKANRAAQRDRVQRRRKAERRFRERLSA